jgi:hypothetical protein
MKHEPTSTNTEAEMFRIRKDIMEADDAIYHLTLKIGDSIIELDRLKKEKASWEARRAELESKKLSHQKELIPQ